MNKTLRWVALAGLTLAPLAFATPAHAQTSPTRAGTVITNTATASFTDANGNSYTDVDASVSVTVGYLRGVDVTSPAEVTPASPSTGNEVIFTITNAGNDHDTFSASTTAGAGVTITGYKIGGTTYTTIGELNTALAGTSLDIGADVEVTVVYTVAPGQGGATIPIEMTATSVGDNAKTDASTTNVKPPAAADVSVTPDGDAINRLPSNGTQYTATFTVENTGNGSDTFDLTASVPAGTVVTIVSVNGTAGTSGSVVIAAGATANVDVIYTVADVAAGQNEVLTLTATSQLDNTKTDAGTLTVTVIRPAIAMTKEAYRDDMTTPITNNIADPVLPGEYIRYKITVTNNGTADASSVSISDDLPDEVTYVSTTDDGSAGWTLTETGGTVTASLAGTLAPSASRHFWIRVQVK